MKQVSDPRSRPTVFYVVSRIKIRPYKKAKMHKNRHKSMETPPKSTTFEIFFLAAPMRRPVLIFIYRPMYNYIYTFRPNSLIVKITHAFLDVYNVDV